MKNTLLLVLILLIFSASAQGQWKCLYSTYDATLNGTGHNTVSVGVMSPNKFVAMVMTPNARNFLLPYVNADSSHGRVNFCGYGSATANVYQVWTDGGFDQVLMLNAAKVVATPDSLLYVANNDADHNILVFKFTGDTVIATAPFRRQPTGPNRIFGLAIDNNGYVYVSNDTTTGVTDDIKIYKPVAQWKDDHTDVPFRTIDLPNGVYRGITVSPTGSTLFVSDATNRKVLKFTGSPASGYTQNLTFAFQLGAADTLVTTTIRPIPINLAYLSPNNIILAATDVHGYSSTTNGTYEYGRVYLLNPNTGALISTDTTVSVIDCAKWNLTITGAYNDRGDGTLYGNASGYTSTYDVALDQSGNVYTQSYFGWTVDKWSFTGTLPTFTTGVEEITSKVPTTFHVGQNYPNPFNPSTNIEFSILEAGHFSLRVYDLLGREVALLADEFKNAGTYRVRFDAGNLPAGTYFYTLQSGNLSETKKMILLK
ncbi:MAG: T9SS type A sorting domain-containing protein [Bacteroidota bacterium]